MNIEIIVVEDNRGDAELLQEAFLENDSSTNLIFIRDAKGALAFLHQESGVSNNQKPNLIVLDLKMPRIDGFSFLREIKSSHSMSSIPVVILTGSDANSDKKLALSLGAKSYFIKPSRLKDWTGLAAKLDTLASLKEDW